MSRLVGTRIIFFLLSFLTTSIFGKCQSYEVVEGDTAYFETIPRQSFITYGDYNYYLKKTLPDGYYYIQDRYGRKIRRETLKNGTNYSIKINEFGDTLYRPIEVIYYYKYPLVRDIRDCNCDWEYLEWECEVSPIHFSYYKNDSLRSVSKNMQRDSLGGLVKEYHEQIWFENGQLNHEYKTYTFIKDNKETWCRNWKTFGENGKLQSERELSYKHNKVSNIETVYKDGVLHRNILTESITKNNFPFGYRKKVTTVTTLEYERGLLKKKVVQKGDRIIYRKEYN